MKKLNLLMSVLLLSSCVVEQQATKFTRLRDVPVGPDDNLSTEEDKKLVFEYQLPVENDIPLNVKLVAKPKNGTFGSCVKTDFNKYQCEYVPAKDFYGQDKILLKAQDGDLISSDTATITIDVTPVADAPTAYDTSAFGPFSQPVVFKLPQAKDPDSLSSDLTYQITNQPSNGTVSCVKQDCTYQANGNFIGSDIFKYKVVDEGSASSEKANIEILISPEDAVETFTQGVSGVNGVDIVWVVDNSGSMADEQQTLADSFESFANNLVFQDGTPKFSYNMGVIATDTYLKLSNQNSFEVKNNGTAYDLSSSYTAQSFTNFKNDFSTAALVGTSGSGSERALQSMERSFVLDPSFYGGDDRLLVYIILTDEKEQSCYVCIKPNGGQINTANMYSNKQSSDSDINQWFNLITGWKDSADKVKVFPIIKLSEDTFGRFAKIASMTGASVKDLYANFNSVLNDIGSEVSQLVNSFTISTDKNVVTDSVEVFVNNQKLNSGWSISQKTISFTSPPAENATIKVKYKYY